MELEPPEKFQMTKKRRKEKIVWHKNSKKVKNIVYDFTEDTGEDIGEDTRAIQNVMQLI